MRGTPKSKRPMLESLAMAALGGVHMSKGRTFRLYPHDTAARERNAASAGARRSHNEAVDQKKEARDSVNRYTFVPRKASHKQGRWA